MLRRVEDVNYDDKGYYDMSKGIWDMLGYTHQNNELAIKFLTSHN